MPGALPAIPRPTEERGLLQAGSSPCTQASLSTSHPILPSVNLCPISAGSRQVLETLECGLAASGLTKWFPQWSPSAELNGGPAWPLLVETTGDSLLTETLLLFPPLP